MNNGGARIPLDHAVEALDELLICREAGRLAGGLRPEAQAGVEERRERRHHALAQRFDGDERL